MRGPNAAERSEHQGQSAVIATSDSAPTTTPIARDDPAGNYQDAGELSDQDHPGIASDAGFSGDGVSDEPRSTGSRGPASADAVMADQEQAAAPDDTARSLDAGSVSTEGQQAADASSAASTRIDHSDQDTQPGQADNADSPDPPDPPGGDSQADTSPEARIAELQAQLAKANIELAQTKGELDQTKNQLDQSYGELDKTKNELDETKGQLSEIKNELDQANQEIAGLRASSTEHGSPVKDAQKPPGASQAPADAGHPEQQTEDADKSREQDAAGEESKVPDQEFDTKVSERNKTRMRQVVSPDNVAIGAALWDAQDAVQKIAGHAMHDAVSPSVAVAIGVAGVVLSKIRERKKEQGK